MAVAWSASSCLGAAAWPIDPVSRLYLGAERASSSQAVWAFMVGLHDRGGLSLFVELARRSLGGFQFGADGEVLPDTIVFLQEPPFNNVFLMVILIWIQTGFSMVISVGSDQGRPDRNSIEAATGRRCNRIAELLLGSSCPRSCRPLGWSPPR